MWLVHQTGRYDGIWLTMVCVLGICCRRSIAVTDTVTELSIFMTSQYTYTEALTECQKTAGAVMMDLRSAQLDWFLNALNNLNNDGSITLGLTSDVYWIGMTYSRAANQWTYSSDNTLVSAATLGKFPVNDFCQVTGENGALYRETSSGSWKEICVGSIDTKHTVCVIPRSTQCAFIASSSREFYPPDSGSMTATVHIENTNTNCETRCRTASDPEQCWYYSYNSASTECRVYYSPQPLWDATCYMTPNTDWNSFIKSCTTFTFDNGLSVTPNCSAVPPAIPPLPPPTFANNPVITGTPGSSVTSSVVTVDTSQSVNISNASSPVSPGIQLMQALAQADASDKQLEGIHGFLPLTLSLLIYNAALIMGITIGLFCCMTSDNQPKQLFSQVTPMETQKAILHNPDADNYDTLHDNNKAQGNDTGNNNTDVQHNTNDLERNHNDGSDHANIDRVARANNPNRMDNQNGPPRYENHNSAYYNNSAYGNDPNDPNRVNNNSETDNGPGSNGRLTNDYHDSQVEGNTGINRHNQGNQYENGGYYGRQDNTNIYGTENSTSNEYGNQQGTGNLDGSYLQRPYNNGQIRTTPRQTHRIWRY